MFTRNVEEPIRRRCVWGAAIFFSLAPDLDAIPGFISGNMAMYHNQITHSVFFGLAACLLATGLFKLCFRRFLGWWSYARMASLASASYGLHLVMDGMSLSPGMKLLWPFMNERFSLPVNLFYGVRHSEGLFSTHHLITIGNELAIIAACLLLARFMFGKRPRMPGMIPIK